MPKRGLDVGACEVFRFYRLIPVKDLVEPLSMIVPRKQVLIDTKVNYNSEFFNLTSCSGPSVGGFSGGPVPDDSWKPASSDGPGVAAGD